MVNIVFSFNFLSLPLSLAWCRRVRAIIRFLRSLRELLKQSRSDLRYQGVRRVDVPDWIVRGDERVGGDPPSHTTVLDIIPTKTERARPALLSDPPAGPRCCGCRGLLVSPPQ